MSPKNSYKKWEIRHAGINPIPSSLGNTTDGSSDLVRQDEPGKGCKGDISLGPWLKAGRCALILSRPGPAQVAEPESGSREPQAGDTVSHQTVTGPRRPELPNRKGKNSLKEAPAPDTQAQNGVCLPLLPPHPQFGLQIHLTLCYHPVGSLLLTPGPASPVYLPWAAPGQPS